MSTGPSRAMTAARAQFGLWHYSLWHIRNVTLRIYI